MSDGRFTCARVDKVANLEVFSYLAHAEVEGFLSADPMPWKKRK